MEVSEMVGRNMRRIRKDVGLSGAQVAEVCGWTRDKQSRLERGITHITVDELVAVAKCLSVPSALLLAERTT